MPISKATRLNVMLVVLVSVAAGAYALRQKPAASTETFTTISGQQIALNDLRGKIILINFWATSCGICITEMPDLIATYRQYQPQGLEVIAVAMPYDDPEQVRLYAARHTLPFPVVFDKGGDLARDYGQVKVIPVTFIIDKSGQRISKTIGIINFSKLRAYLDTALAAGR